MKINEITEVNPSIISPDVKELGSIFARNNFEIRVVGGAVRDVALGKSPKDIDLATDATPQEMQKMFDRAMIKHIPTGIEHGTITAVLNNEPYEITTLRSDAETDGRHAKVEFVRSWEEDAKRRDLTYNAMSMDLDGEIHDYFGGMDDLQDKVSKFVGNPIDRIQEDYLRILRYFRFQGRLSTPTWDKETLEAISSNVKGLAQISAERVWSEMGKILSGQNVANILATIKDTGASQVIGLNVDNLNTVKDNSNPIIVLAQLNNSVDIAKRWKMKNTEADLLNFLSQNKDNRLDKKKVEDMIADGIAKEKISALAELQDQKKMANHAMVTSIPEFPINGADLIAKGVPQGPEIGKTLNTLKQQWKQSNFKATKQDLLGEEVEVSLHGDAKKGYVLSKIEVSGDERNAGQGTKAMQDIVDRMDREGAIIALTPDDAFGGNKNRLIKFYKRFGFVPNKGRNKDFRFRETMIRYPQSNVEENFADGKVKGKSKPGRVKKSGASCNGSVTELRAKAKKASGEKAKMYHWCANMKSGKKK